LIRRKLVNGILVRWSCHFVINYKRKCMAPILTILEGECRNFK
jgi:hypothetical protein